MRSSQKPGSLPVPGCVLQCVSLRTAGPPGSARTYPRNSGASGRARHRRSRSAPPTSTDGRGAVNPAVRRVHPVGGRARRAPRRSAAPGFPARARGETVRRIRHGCGGPPGPAGDGRGGRRAAAAGGGYGTGSGRAGGGRPADRDEAGGQPARAAGAGSGAGRSRRATTGWRGALRARRGTALRHPTATPGPCPAPRDPHSPRRLLPVATGGFRLDVPSQRTAAPKGDQTDTRRQCLVRNSEGLPCISAVLDPRTVRKPTVTRPSRAPPSARPSTVDLRRRGAARRACVPRRRPRRRTVPARPDMPAARPRGGGAPRPRPRAPP